MCEFTYPIYVPSIKENLYFKEFTNRQYKQFVKIIINDDIVCFNSFVNRLICDLCDDINIKDLTVLDKLYILYTIRSVNVGPTLEFNIDSSIENKVKFKINMIELLEKLESYDIDEVYEISEEGFSAKCCLPKTFLASDNIYDSMYNCIDEFSFDGKTVNLTEFSYNERKKILSALPGTIIGKVFSLFKQKEQVLSKEPFIDIKVPCEVPFEKQLYLSLFNNSVYELVKLVFNTNLRDFYVYEYTLIKKFKFSYDHINSVTPAELRVYFNVISEDLEKEKKEQDSRDQQQQYTT